MKNKDKIDLRREKLRKLLFKEMEEYQYQAYSNNCPESLLNKFIIFNNYNLKNIPKEEEKNNYFNKEPNNKNINNIQIQYKNNNDNNGQEINFDPSNTLNRNFNDINLDKKPFGNTNINENLLQEPNFSYNNELLNQQQNKKFINSNQINISPNYKYGNTEIDAEINGYSDYYNQLRVDEYMSKKRIQDDLLNQINQKLNKINRNINDKTYQENLAFQYFQNKNKIKI